MMTVIAHTTPTEVPTGLLLVAVGFVVGVLTVMVARRFLPTR